MENKSTVLRTGQKASLLWILVMFNMVFADILSFMLPGTLQEAAAMNVTQPLLLVFAFLLEIPIAMIFLSRVLKPSLNWILNTVAAVVTAAFVIGGGSLTLHYIFFAGVEVLCMIAIVVISWRARRD
jgi:hypothetical protein